MVVFAVSLLMAMVDTSSSSDLFFWFTMISVVIINSSNGICQNTIFGMAVKLPRKYAGCIILGNNISGVFVAIVSIISTAVSSNSRIAAIYYFITALFVLLVCFDSYFALPLFVSIFSVFFEKYADMLIDDNFQSLQTHLICVSGIDDTIRVSIRIRKMVESKKF